MECALSRYGVDRVFRAVGWPHSGSADCVAGETRRFGRDRCTWERIPQLPDLNVDLQRNRWRALSGADWMSNFGPAAHFECGVGNRRIHSGQRRKILSLSACHPADQMNGRQPLDGAGARLLIISAQRVPE
jgi:hypothetical protein